MARLRPTRRAERLPIAVAPSTFYRGSTSTDPYTATTGYTEAFDTVGSAATGTDAASLDVQEKTLGTSVAAVSNTFTATSNLGTTMRPTSADSLFSLRPRGSKTSASRSLRGSV